MKLQGLYRMTVTTDWRVPLPRPWHWTFGARSAAVVAQGRVVIASELQGLSEAGQVQAPFAAVLVGMGDHAELWPWAAWEAEQKRAIDWADLEVRRLLGLSAPSLLSLRLDGEPASLRHRFCRALARIQASVALGVVAVAMLAFYAGYLAGLPKPLTPEEVVLRMEQLAQEQEIRAVPSRRSSGGRP